MAEGKRYYWLKLYDDFFGSKRIKKLRKLAGGDTYTIIYLKMQLKAIKTDGILQWTGVEDDFVSELALDLDESPDDVSVTLQYLLSKGLAETDDNINFFFPYAVANTGSETAATQRWREWNERKKNQKVLDSNTTPTLPQQTANVETETRDRDKRKKQDTRDRDKTLSPVGEVTVERRQGEEEYSTEFERFWFVYPKKVGKKEAYRAFKKANKPVQLLVAAVNAQLQSEQWNKENGRFIPNPATWLNQGRWDDQIIRRKQNEFLQMLEDESNDKARHYEDSVFVVDDL